MIRTDLYIVYSPNELVDEYAEIKFKFLSSFILPWRNMVHSMIASTMHRVDRCSKYTSSIAVCIETMLCVCPIRRIS